MSRVRGVTLQLAFARWLTRWWPAAESTGSGRKGRDVQNTPGVWWEVKTADEFEPQEWMRQAQDGLRKELRKELPVVVWFGRSVAMGSPQKVIAMMPLPWLMHLLEEAGYAPAPQEEETG